MSNGDLRAFRALTAPDFIFVAEDSQIHTRKELLEVLKPDLEPSGIPPVEMRDYTLHQSRGTVTVTYHLCETGSYLGSPLTGMDTITATWQRLASGWKLRVLHMTAVPIDPPAVTLPTSELDQLTGQYRAASFVICLSREGDHLIEDTGSRRILVRAAGRDLLFTPGLPRLRMIFLRDMQGNVVGFTSRNENRSIRFTRLP